MIVYVLTFTDKDGQDRTLTVVSSISLSSIYLEQYIRLIICDKSKSIGYDVNNEILLAGTAWSYSQYSSIQSHCLNVSGDSMVFQSFEALVEMICLICLD